MSTTIQNMKDIGPMAGGDRAKNESDPVKADYEEGKRFLNNGNLAQAAVSFHNALLGYEERGDKTGLANASNQLGHVCMAKEDYVGAENHYRRSLQLCEEFGDAMSLFTLSKRFVEVYRGQKSYDKAIEACLDLLDTYQKNNDPRGTVELLENMAEIYVEAGTVDKAADTYRTIAKIHRNYKHNSIADSFDEKAREIAAGA
ncbi:tetratricopeptide repeat protein [Desulfopila aestuarii]|uniref:Tetratricopeptide repeat-containing protein n=1 Tax=Desulfopila aestuarii DSM 18488 TaxID=1121416 RepID=A0A1M7Y0E2_9BACT|nr:tetratricopeptide repeat protein [Desulfopila aestuarii]SHO45057.1 Tetratricopeptide repeat-containing protein [Desulfopila aestuarii DSM 18488]